MKWEVIVNNDEHIFISSSTTTNTGRKKWVKSYETIEWILSQWHETMTGKINDDDEVETINEV